MPVKNARKERSREHLTKDEVDKLLAAAKRGDLSRNPERDHCLLFLMVRHGLRVSEAAKLKLSDVDLETRTIYIKRLKRGKPAVHPIYNAGEMKALQEWLKIRKTIVSDYDNLFLSEQRKPINRATVWMLVDKYGRAAGLGNLNLHPHMLRHACGFDLANRGNDTRLIQGYLGHQNIQHTVRYTELAPNRFANLY
ncbi:MAG: tyrosine-type recombinase/integrase [Verrucomicrobia bacterium]|nr:tyrosine-type recombinase/integrase [Verrucomicrobiota bacterium]